MPSKISLHYVSKDIPDYRKAMNSFKKEIRRIDSELQGPSCKIDEQNDVLAEFQDGDGDGSPVQYEIHKKQPSSHKPKRQKLISMNCSLNPELNFFKDISASNLQKKKKTDFRLPTLDKKNIFHNSYADEQAIMPKIIKVPIDRLIPLRSEDVKRKFESKYRLSSDHQLR